MTFNDYLLIALAVYGAASATVCLLIILLFSPRIIRFFIEEFGAMIRDEIRYKYRQFGDWLRRIRPSEVMMNLIMIAFGLTAMVIIVGTLRANILALF